MNTSIIYYNLYTTSIKTIIKAPSSIENLLEEREKDGLYNNKITISLVQPTYFEASHLYQSYLINTVFNTKWK